MTLINTIEIMDGLGIQLDNLKSGNLQELAHNPERGLD